MNKLLTKTLIKFNQKYLKSLIYFNLLEIRFIDYKFVLPDNHIEYIIEIEDKILQGVWKFSARYNLLREMHLNLIENNKNIEKIPNFPIKNILANSHEKFIKKRKNELQNYFTTLINQNSIEFHSLTNFIGNVISNQMELNIVEYSNKLNKWENTKVLNFNLIDIQTAFLEVKLKEIDKVYKYLQQNDRNLIKIFAKKMKFEVESSKI